MRTCSHVKFLVADSAEQLPATAFWAIRFGYMITKVRGIMQTLDQPFCQGPIASQVNGHSR